MHFVREQQRRPTRLRGNEDAEGSRGASEREREGGTRANGVAREIRARRRERSGFPRDGGRRGRRDGSLGRALGRLSLTQHSYPGPKCDVILHNSPNCIVAAAARCTALRTAAARPAPHPAYLRSAFLPPSFFLCLSHPALVTPKVRGESEARDSSNWGPTSKDQRASPWVSVCVFSERSTRTTRLRYTVNESPTDSELYDRGCEIHYVARYGELRNFANVHFSESRLRIIDFVLSSAQTTNYRAVANRVVTE